MNTTAGLYRGPTRPARAFRIAYTGSPEQTGELLAEVLAEARQWGGAAVIESVDAAGEGRESITVRVTFAYGLGAFSPVHTWLSACAVKGATITEC